MKETDIRKREVHNRYLELVQIDSEKIFSDKSSFVDVDYAAWGLSKPVFEFEKGGFTYVRCPETDTLFVSPRPTYQHLMEIYRDSPSTKFWIEEFFLPVVDVRREKIFKPRAEYVSGKFPELRMGCIADVGSGFGLFLDELKKMWSDSDLVAIEPSCDMAQICSDKGLRVIESLLENVDPTQNSFDLMTAFELFEHLHDPKIFLEKIYQLLKPGGYLFLSTLNGLGFDIQLLWEKSKSVTPPHHLNFFNPTSLSSLLDSVGFEVVEVLTPGELDWDIIEGCYLHEQASPGRFFKTVSKYGTDVAKKELQDWIRKHKFSSHMRVIARRPIKNG